MPELPGITDNLAPIGLGGHNLVGIPLSADQIASPTASILANVQARYYLNTVPFTEYFSTGSILSQVNGGSSGLSTAGVQQLINTSLATQSQTFNQQIAQINSVLGTAPYQVGTQSYATIPLALAATSQTAGGGSAPTITAAPTINDSTVDVGQANVGVTAGTSTGGTNVTRSYRWVVAGVAQSSIWQPVGGLAQTVAAGGGVALSTTQVLVLEELVSYTGSTIAISNKSINYTLNAGAAVPSKTIDPSVSGTASPGSVLTFNPGSWSNTPTTFDYNVYDGATPALGGQLLTTQTLAAASTATLTVPSTYAGKTLQLEVIAHNAAGASLPAYALPVAVSGGTVPVQIAPVGFLVTGGTGTSPVATALSFDYGLLAGTSLSDYWSNAPSATGFTVILMRDGVSFGSFSNLTTYTPVSLDQDKTLSYSVVASNGAGASAPSTTFPNPSIQIVAQVGGGGTGTTTSFVGKALAGTNSATSLSIAPSAVVAAMLTNDRVFHIRSNNGGAGVTWPAAPTGFTTAVDSFLLTSKNVDIYSKAVTGSEPANYVSTPSQAEILGAVLVAWRKSDGTTPAILGTPGHTLQTTMQTSPFTASFPSITAGGSAAAGQRQALIVVLDPNSAESTTFSNIPAGFGSGPVAALEFTGNGVNWQPIYVFDGPAPTSGATGVLNMTVTTSTGTAGWAGATFIVG